MIAGLAVLVLAGAFGVLAKTGKLKMFASTTDQVELTITAKYSDGVPWSNQHIIADRYRVLGEDLENAGSQTTDNQGVAKFILQKNYFYNFNTQPPRIETPSCRGALLNYYSVRSESKTITIGCASSSDTVTSQSFTFKGRVEAYSGRVLTPIPNATVELTISETDKKVTGLSKATGEVTLENVPIVAGKYPNQYIVKASKAGYTTKQYDFNYLFTSTITPFEAGKEYQADRSIILATTASSPTPTATASASSIPTADQTKMTILGKISRVGDHQQEIIVGGVQAEASLVGYTGQGPWRAGSSTSVRGTSDRGDYNLRIGDVFNPASPRSVVREIQVTLQTDFDYYYDTNNNSQYDEQIDNKIIIPAQGDEKSPHLDQSLNLYVSYLEIKLLKKNPLSKANTLHLVGVVSTPDLRPASVAPLDGVKVTARVISRDNETLGTWTVYTTAANSSEYSSDYGIDGILDIRAMEGTIIVLSGEKEGYYFDSNKNGIYDLSDGSRAIIPPDIHSSPHFEYLTMKKIASLDLEISFFDGVTGQPIDLNNETITKNDLLCNPTFLEVDVYACATSSAPNGNKITYNISEESTRTRVARYNLSFETQNYRLFESDRVSILNSFDTYEPTQDVFLVPKAADEQDVVTCREIFAVKFCTLAGYANQVFTEENTVNLEKYAKIIVYLSVKLGIPAEDIPTVFIPPPGFNSSLGGQAIGSRNQIIIDSRYLRDGTVEAGITVIVHEFGHIVDNRFHVTGMPGFNDVQFFRNQFLKAVNASRAGQCDQKFPQYGCFSTYSLTNRFENWAEFFTFWVLHYGDIQRAYNDPEMNKPENADCLHALQYLDALMREKFPNMVNFNSGAPAFQTSMSFGEGRVMGAYDDLNEDETVQFFRDAGFQLATKTTFNLVGLLRNMPLTSEQIANGEFLKKIYTTLPLQRRVAIQTNIALNKTKNSIMGITGIKSFPTIRESIRRLNNDIETMLKRIGFKFSTAKIYGTVLDQKNTRLSRVVVTVGKKSTVTSDTGYFQINRLKDGENVVKVVDPNIDKTYYNRRIQVKPDKTIKQNIIVTRPRYRIKGKITKNEQPLNGGRIELKSTDGKIRYYPIDATGKFSLWSPQGRYKMRILDKNKRAIQIISSSTIDNPNSIILDSNISTTIKVQ